jgi:LemA protein
MRRDKSVFITVIVVVVLLVWFSAAYRGLVNERNNMRMQWSDIESEYQRQVDLIPEITRTIKGNTQLEAEFLSYIGELRYQWINCRTAGQKIDTAGEIDSMMSNLYVLYENYPEFQSEERVRSLIARVSDNEREIASERAEYNHLAEEYNSELSKFPVNIIASITGFVEFPYFES